MRGSPGPTEIVGVVAGVLFVLAVIVMPKPARQAAEGSKGARNSMFQIAGGAFGRVWGYVTLTDDLGRATLWAVAAVWLTRIPYVLLTPVLGVLDYDLISTGTLNIFRSGRPPNVSAAFVQSRTVPGMQYVFLAVLVLMVFGESSHRFSQQAKRYPEISPTARLARLILALLVLVALMIVVIVLAFVEGHGSPHAKLPQSAVYAVNACTALSISATIPLAQSGFREGVIAVVVVAGVSSAAIACVLLGVIFVAISAVFLGLAWLGGHARRGKHGKP